ncbi:hypothetical protein MSPP1_003945 [Malassezia sp. CBS 17886]|nr:hypothetical protein MSPP1_003945 [Malassezia sp. CBS 17886]
MDPLCGACGAVGTVQWMDDAAAYVCVACASLRGGDDAWPDAPDPRVDVPVAPVPAPPLRRLRQRHYDPAAARAAAHRAHKASVDALLHAAATRLGYVYVVPRASAAFDQVFAAARAKCAPPQMRRWGPAAYALAAATLYAALRDDGRLVDVAAVAMAADLPLASVRDACYTLRMLQLPQFASLRVHDLGPHVEAQLAFMAAALRAPPPTGRVPAAAPLPPVPACDAQQLDALWPALAQQDAGLVRRLALHIAHMCMEYTLSTSLDLRALAFAVVVHAYEGAQQATLPVRAMARIAPHAMQHVPATGWFFAAHAAPSAGSHSTVLARYAEVEKMLAMRVRMLPWVAARSVTKKERDRMRRRRGAPGVHRTDGREACWRAAVGDGERGGGHTETTRADALGDTPSPDGHSDTLRLVARSDTAFYLQDLVAVQERAGGGESGKESSGGDAEEARGTHGRRGTVGLNPHGLGPHEPGPPGFHPDTCVPELHAGIPLHAPLLPTSRRDAPRWTHAFQPPAHRAASESGRPTASSAPSASLAGRLHLAGTSIDTLTPEEVDSLLFAPHELDSYLRAPHELAVVRRLKGWDEGDGDGSFATGTGRGADACSMLPHRDDGHVHAASVGRAVAEDDTSDVHPPCHATRRTRIHTAARHLLQPLDLAAQTEGDEDWGGIAEPGDSGA